MVLLFFARYIYLSQSDELSLHEYVSRRIPSTYDYTEPFGGGCNASSYFPAYHYHGMCSRCDDEYISPFMEIEICRSGGMKRGSNENFYEFICCDM